MRAGHLDDEGALEVVPRLGAPNECQAGVHSSFRKCQLLTWVIPLGPSDGSHNYHEIVAGGSIPTSAEGLDRVSYGSLQRGALLSYGLSISWMYRQAGEYVAQILKGASGAELLSCSRRNELVINLETAKAFALEVPPMLLARADELIE
jgi:hypothetical protein